MLQRALEHARVNFTKLVLAAKEDIYWEDFVRPSIKEIELVKDPFPHIILDDFFKPDIYAGLVEDFRRAQQKGYSKDWEDVGKFRSFKIDYDGYFFVPDATINSSYPGSLFWSIEWNRAFSKVFRQYTTFEVSLALHHHPPGDRTGFVHHDYADKKFYSKVVLPNGIVPYERDGTPTHDTVRRRAIAILFFLGNDGWQEGDGGEIGLYAADKKTLIKKVAPINNRLFAFHISDRSYHAFQGNRKERNSIIQWFHAPERDVLPYAG